MEPDSHSNVRWFWGQGWSRFAVFSVVGGGLILLAHSLFPHARWYIAIFAVLLMLAFGYSEWQDKKGKEDRLGDDFYYLGLTYTLLSVVMALYAFTSRAAVDRLVSDFSVALLTTLTGIVARVLLYEKHASAKGPAEIDEGIVQLRAEIERAVQQIQEFRRGVAANLQQAGDSVLQSVSSASAHFSASANELGDAAKAMNASLKKGASAFDKGFGRIGDASDALGGRVNALLEATRSLESASEALNGQVGSVNASIEQGSKALASTLDVQNESTRRVRADLESLSAPVSLLAGSMNEMRLQVDAAKQEFTSPQLKMSIADCREAAENLSRNLRSIANTLSPSSAEANFSVLEAFGAAITELTAQADACSRNLARLAEQPHGEPPKSESFRSNDGSPTHRTRQSPDSLSPSGTGAPIYPIAPIPEKDPVIGSPTNNPAEPNSPPTAQDDKHAENRESEEGSKSWMRWPWRRD